ncbi:MAG: HAD family hydrolase [Anaerolineales bacterium]|nr:HAD family hydrolase [Anaerolineales bacterium]
MLLHIPSTYKHVIWDWNGTLFDDAWLCRGIMNNMLAQRNLPGLSAERYAEIFDFPVKAYYQSAGWDFNLTPFETLSDEFINEYERRKLECAVRPEGLAVLEALHTAGIPQSIVSAYKQVSLVPLIAHYQIDTWLVGMRGLDNHHAAGKVEVGRRWVAELDLDPADILLVGDTLHDHEMAIELGIDCVLLPSGHQSRTRLQTSGATLLASLSELLPT